MADLALGMNNRFCDGTTDYFSLWVSDWNLTMIVWVEWMGKTLAMTDDQQ